MREICCSLLPSWSLFFVHGGVEKEEEEEEEEEEKVEKGITPKTTTTGGGSSPSSLYWRPSWVMSENSIPAKRTS